MAVGLVHEVAVGAHPGGADAWAYQGSLAQAVSVGVPPGACDARGQD